MLPLVGSLNSTESCTSSVLHRVLRVLELDGGCRGGDDIRSEVARNE